MTYKYGEVYQLWGIGSVDPFYFMYVGPVERGEHIGWSLWAKPGWFRVHDTHMAEAIHVEKNGEDLMLTYTATF